MAKNYHTRLTQIPALARQIGLGITGGEIFALVGDLGAGKTTFVKKLAKYLKVKTKVTSPTFILMAEHKAKTKKGKALRLYHLDLYRTKNFSEIKTLGLTEIWKQPDTVVLIEWADKIKAHLPKNTNFIYFKNEKFL